MQVKRIWVCRRYVGSASSRTACSSFQWQERLAVAAAAGDWVPGWAAAAAAAAAAAGRTSCSSARSCQTLSALSGALDLPRPRPVPRLPSAGP